METKQTAVDWLEENLIGNPHFESDFIHNRNTFKQAKAMEKEQIKEAYIDGCIGEMYEVSATYTAEEYYNKTYANDTTTGLPKEDSKRRGWHY